PTTFNAFRHLAYLYHHQLENPAKAIVYYQKARKQSPDNPGFTYYFLAELLWKNKGDFREALEVIAEGLSVLKQNKSPTDRTFNGFMLQPLNAKADLHDLMGDIYAEELQDKKQAFDHFQQAIKFAPNRVAIHLKRIRIAFEVFKNDLQTEEFCLQALKYAPKNVEIKGYLKKAQKI
ncbi:MAG: tetratricopeptide repeat protein, partial [Chitinophagales bacterium]